MIPTKTKIDYASLYADFTAPIHQFDCGKRCAPHNDNGIPFCCDTCHAVPTLYDTEWQYLQVSTDLWHEFRGDECDGVTEDQAAEERERLGEEMPDNMILAACLGPALCQRDYRGLTCRQFPFFPYIDSQGEFLGLSYYWDYEDTCWVISNLEVVESEYRQQFIESFEHIFAVMPEEHEAYKVHSEVMRDKFNEARRAIPLLHRNGHTYKISTHNERMRRVDVASLPKYGPYKLAAKMPFPDEIR